MDKLWKWDRIALGLGVFALLCGADAFFQESFGNLWLLQWVATLASVMAGLAGWRSGSKSFIVLGAGCAVLSWFSYVGLFASCFSGDCL
jgi:hypothetical protein